MFPHETADPSLSSFSLFGILTMSVGLYWLHHFVGNIQRIFIKVTECKKDLFVTEQQFSSVTAEECVCV